LIVIMILGYGDVICGIAAAWMSCACDSIDGTPLQKGIYAVRSSRLNALAMEVLDVIGSGATVSKVSGRLEWSEGGSKYLARLSMPSVLFWSTVLPMASVDHGLFVYANSVYYI
jgi:hypothetical protein